MPSQALASGDPDLVPAALRSDYLVAYTGALDELFLVSAIVAFVGAVAAAIFVRPQDFVSHQG